MGGAVATPAVITALATATEVPARPVATAEPAITRPAAVGGTARAVAVAALTARPAVSSVVAAAAAAALTAAEGVVIGARPPAVPVPVTLVARGPPVVAAPAAFAVAAITRAAITRAAITRPPVPAIPATAVAAATALPTRTAVSSGASGTAGATASAATRAPAPVSGAATLRRIAVFGHCPDLLHTQSFTLRASHRAPTPSGLANLARRPAAVPTNQWEQRLTPREHRARSPPGNHSNGRRPRSHERPSLATQEGQVARESQVPSALRTSGSLRLRPESKPAWVLTFGSAGEHGAPVDMRPRFGTRLFESRARGRASTRPGHPSTARPDK